jgi:hypothetical protein
MVGIETINKPLINRFSSGSPVPVFEVAEDTYLSRVKGRNFWILSHFFPHRPRSTGSGSMTQHRKNAIR